MTPTGRIVAVQSLFLVSGFCGLVYESIWSQYLKLFLGHAAYAQSVVLVVFIGGMALGAWGAGRVSHRLPRPLVAYAAAELVVGCMALAFHPVFVASTDWAYDTLLPATCTVDAPCLASWMLAAALILPQSVLLGTTFPLMTSGVLRLAPRDPGRRVALLYFLNSLGAVVGVLACVFVVVPLAGLPGASMLAGATNIVLATAVYALARRAPPARAMVERPAGRSAAPWLLFAVAAFTGLASFGYEIAWIRMLALVLGSSTHAFELMLASFILGLALGGAWIRRRIDRLSSPRAWLGVIQVLMGLAALASIVLYDRAFDTMAWLIGALAKTDGGYALFNLGSAGIAMAIMLPATFAAGMTLPLITFLLLRDGFGERAIGYVYAWNTLGAIAGVLLAVHVGLPQLGLAGTLIAAAAVDIALGVVLLGVPGRTLRGAILAAFVASSLALVALAPFTLQIDPRRTIAAVYRSGIAAIRDEMTILFDRDGKTATVSVTRLPSGIVTIRTNGKPDASANLGADRSWTLGDESTMILSAALPLMHAPHARDVAVIGFGSGMTTATLLDLPSIRAVDTIEIEPAMIDGARHFGDKVARAYDDPRSTIVVDDAKSYFAKANRRYDIIVSEPSNPWVAGVSSLFTGEFYRQAARHLNDGGVLAQWLQGYEFDRPLLASILKAALETFPDATLYGTNGTDLILVATRGAGRVDAGPLFASPAFAQRLASAGIASSADIDRRRILGARGLAAFVASSDAPPNSDYHPYVELNAPAARFKGRSVKDVIDLVGAIVPVVDLVEGRAPPGAMPPPSPPSAFGLAEDWANAREAYAFVTGPGFVAGDALPDIEHARDIANARAALVDCVRAPSTAIAWDAVVALAGAFTPVLPAADMDRYADVVEQSRCRAVLPDTTPTWIALFRAIGRRDAATTAAAAGTLAARDDLTPRQREYATLAAVAGALGAGRRDDARRMLLEERSDLGAVFRASAAFRYLLDASAR